MTEKAEEFKPNERVEINSTSLGLVQGIVLGAAPKSLPGWENMQLLLLDNPAPEGKEWRPSPKLFDSFKSHMKALGIEGIDSKSPRLWAAEPSDYLGASTLKKLPMTNPTETTKLQVGDRVKDKDGQVGTVFSVGERNATDEWTRVIYDLAINKSEQVLTLALQKVITDMGLTYLPNGWKAYKANSDEKSLTKLPPLDDYLSYKGDRLLISITHENGKRAVVAGTVVDDDRSSCPIVLLGKPHEFCGTKQKIKSEGSDADWDDQSIKEAKAIAKELGIEWSANCFTALPHTSRWNNKNYTIDILAVLSPPVVEEQVSNEDVIVGDEAVFLDPSGVEHTGIIVDEAYNGTPPLACVKTRKGNATGLTNVDGEYGALIKHQVKKLGIKGGHYCAVSKVKRITKKAPPTPKIKHTTLKVGDVIKITNNAGKYVNDAVVIHKTNKTVILARKGIFDDPYASFLSSFLSIADLQSAERKKAIKGLDACGLPHSCAVLYFDKDEHDILEVKSADITQTMAITGNNHLSAGSLQIGDKIIIDVNGIDVLATVVSQSAISGAMTVVCKAYSHQLDSSTGFADPRGLYYTNAVHLKCFDSSIDSSISYYYYDAISHYKSMVERSETISINELKPGDTFTFVHNGEVANATVLLDDPTEGILFEIESTSEPLKDGFDLNLDPDIDRKMIKALEDAAKQLNIKRPYKYRTGRLIKSLPYDIRVIARKPGTPMKTSKSNDAKSNDADLAVGDQVSVYTGTDALHEAVVLDTAKTLAILDGTRALGVPGAKKLTAAQKKKAVALGIENATHSFNYSSATSIVKTKSAPQLVDAQDLMLGDVIRFKKRRGGFITGTVVLTTEDEYDGDVLVLIDGEDGRTTLDDAVETDLIEANLKRLEIKPMGKKEQRFEYLFSNDDQVSLIKKGTPLPIIETTSLKLGDRITYSSQSNLIKGTVVQEESAQYEACVILDEDYSENDDEDALHLADCDLEDGWDYDEKNIRRTALDYGINVDGSTMVRSLLGANVLEIIGKQPKVKKRSLDVADLNTGDRIEIKITDITTPRAKAKKVSATYLDDGFVLFDKPHNFEYGKSFSLDTADYPYGAVNGLEQLDLKLDDNEERLWEIEAHDTEIIKITKRATAHKQKDTTMTDKEETSFLETFKSDAAEAGYRICSTQMTNGVKNGLVLALTNKGGDGEKAAMLKAFLETDIGTAMIGYMLGQGLPHIPGLQDDPRITKLAAEFRTNGMAVAGNALVGQAMEYVLPAIKDAMTALPALPEKAATGVRVKSPPKTVENDEHSNEETAKVATIGRR